MSASKPTLEDPLIAALPPNTDYITYLTILEYYLTPKNLPTLNRLLQEDDGTLASEIGWDLLKLVLPILRVEPSKARECLDTISRRGNPREVIVRVSEELANIGIDDEEEGDEADPTESSDGLPTFAGEAPRVHLGEMTLAGMPPLYKPEHGPQKHEDEEQMPDAAVEELKLQSLLSMLGLLHPRIKTPHPSRFLATSLPAALSAYRRLTMNAESTLAFLDTLAKLSGKQRPALPPRVSTNDALKQQSTTTGTRPVASAPLPDPESNSESTETSTATARVEAAINRRLLQAVLLEIIEEHTTASSEAQPPLTARLRVQYHPQSISSSRKEELDIVTNSEEIANADSLRSKFVTIGTDLKLDLRAETAKLLEPAIEDAEDEDEDEHEYPTSPSQVPISATGLLLLCNAREFAMARSGQNRPQSFQILTEETNKILELITHQYAVDPRLRQSPPALDCLLSLLYAIFCTPSSISSTIPEDSSIEDNFHAVLPNVFSLLKDIFTTCPDPDLRDNAHNISTHLVHRYFSPIAKSEIIRELLTDADIATLSPIHDTQVGNLKAIAVTWLKDEIYPTQPTLDLMRTQPTTNGGRGQGLPSSKILDLANLLFPVDSIPQPPPLPSQISTFTSTSDEHEHEHERQQAKQSPIATFAINLPFYISALNLLCLYYNTRHNGSDGGSGSDNDVLGAASQAHPFLATLRAWHVWLTHRVADLTTSTTTAAATGSDTVFDIDVDGDGIGVGIVDVFALEDVLSRAEEVLRE